VDQPTLGIQPTALDGFVLVKLEVISATAQALEACREQMALSLVHVRRVETLARGRATWRERCTWLGDAQTYIPAAELVQPRLRQAVDLLLQQLTAAAAPRGSVM
jgi:hypothetical protein